MNSPFFSHRPLRRAATLLCAALAGLGLARGAAAQITGPLPTSPNMPTSYQSPLFHGGGALDPDTLGVPPVLRPGVFQGQLQGTATGVLLSDGTVGTVQTQIPSYLLGNYDPAMPPLALAGGVLPYYPNHFADGSIFSWQAPFDYQAQSTGLVTVDDLSNGTPYTVAASGVTATSGFAATSNWALINNVTTNPSAGTAVNAEYLRLPSNLDGTATWQLVEPVAGSYSLYLNIPNDLVDSAGNPEPRSTAVVYFIAVRDANGNVISTSTATASQTEANANQFLAGPFNLVANGSVTVTLVRDTPSNLNVGLYYLVADAMTLQTAIGDVQSTPTAINIESYPNDFKRAKYWGIYVPMSLPGVNQTTQAVTGNVGADSTPDTTGGSTPNTTPLFHYGDPTLPKDETGAADPKRLIRQLVYFGRSDPVASQSSTLDNTQAGFTSGGGFTVTDASASNGSYFKYPASGGNTGTAVATWNLTTPTTIASTGAHFFVNVHLPRELENRLGAVAYTVTFGTTVVGPVTISQIAPAATDLVVTLPTGPLTLTPGEAVQVKMFNYSGGAAIGNTYVVADSVTLTTGNGQGAIYCVDGFTGGVLWRFETPPSISGASAPVFSSPIVTKINVLVTPAGPANTPPAVYQNKLVVIVGDNNGLVYCLDAIGNGDGTSNANVLAKDAGGNPIAGQPLYELQPTYGTAAPAFDPANPHVGTTPVYWIYRPDPVTPDGKLHGPKYITTTAPTGGPVGTVKPLDIDSDFPVPGSFNTASPTVFVDPNKTGTPDPVTGDVPLNPDGSAPSNATVYIGNSNGVLYALDGTGTTIDGTSAATAIGTGDPFYTSQDLRAAPTVFPAVPADPFVPTTTTKWWFTLRGADPNNANNTSSADIESAPALYVATKADAAMPTGFDFTPTVFIGSAHEQESTSNVGRLYALNGLLGPSGNNGRLLPTAQAFPAPVSIVGPGLSNYNVGQRPQINATDTADWSFPDAYDTTKGGIHTSSNKLPRPALGNVTGSPVVFTDATDFQGITHETNALRQTRVYFAANSGLEVPFGSANGTAAAARPEDTSTGRIWAVNLDGSVGTTTNSGAGGTVWSYPYANDPNDATKDTVAEPQVPIGSFLHGTPAMGFVQFPAAISGYTTVPTDVINTTGILGHSVPMLYIGTRGDTDSALYAIDIDGDVNTAALATGGDQRLIYRVTSPDGAIFQSSPALVTNATSAGGNGGAVYLTGGSNFYDYSATPVSNPITTSVSGTAETGPLIRLNNSFIGFGPFSSPTVAATNVVDLLKINPTNYNTYNSASGYTTDDTDWVYVGDSSTGFCRGITPNDNASAFGGIPPELGLIVPPSVDNPQAQVLDAFIQAYLVADVNKTIPNSANALPIGPKAPLPVYEWGQNVYIRFANVVPPNTITATQPFGDPAKFVYDQAKYPAAALAAASASNPIPFYTNGQAIRFSLSDATTNATVGGLLADNGQVPPITPLTLPPDGFFLDQAPPGSLPASFSANSYNLVDMTGHHWLGTYTYTIADGSARNNTPGSRRTLKNVQQVVTIVNFTNADAAPGHKGDITDPLNFTTVTAGVSATTTLGASATNGNVVSTRNAAGTGYGFTNVQPVDQPAFGILNPIALRGGGTNLLNPGSYAVGVGDGLGPYRPMTVTSIPANTPPGIGTTDAFNLEALANGNDIPLYAPPSSAGGGGTVDPTRPLSVNTLGLNPPTRHHVSITATPLIHHNHSSDNLDPAVYTPPTGVRTAPNANGLPAPPAPFPAPPVPFTIYPYGGFALDLYDRSAVGLLAQQLRIKTGTVSSGGSGLYWNDNTNNVFGSGHDSVVNFLPWEVAPVGYRYGVGSNPSLDYPDISPSNIAALLHPALVVAGNVTGIGAGQDMAEAPANPVPAIGSANAPLDRTIIANPVQFHIIVPRFQSANQQLYQEVPNQGLYSPAGEIPPAGLNNSNNNVFPMGYITTRRIYVPAPGGFYRNGTAYRDVRVYTGVPPDYSMQMGDPTRDVGPVPSGFGVQTNQFAGLKDANGVTTFDPYNLDFQNYFQPLTIYNTGNVNLLNVHLNQRQYVNGTPKALLLNSDVVDPLSAFPAFDLNLSTGPRSGAFGGNNIPEEPFLVRSSLDSDLATAYGINPAILNPANTNASGTPLSQIYRGPTFHKARVGDGSPTTLSVPDAPETFVAGASLNISPNSKPTHSVDTNNGSLPFKSQPFVSVGIPFGTPVGNYYTGLQLVESTDGSGYDPNNVLSPTPYNNVPPGGSHTFSGLAAQLFPPQYGGALGGIGTPSVNSFGQLMDQADPGGPHLADANVALAPVNNPPLSVTPNSSPSTTTLTARVIEDRMTDGASFGAVPMIDQGFAGKDANGVSIQTPDFAPATFRDPASRDLSVYWTSGRNPAGYGIQAANIPYVPASGLAPLGYFFPFDPMRFWWNPFTPALPVGTNSGLTVAQELLIGANSSITGSNVYAFGVNVQAPPTAPTYTNTLFCYPVTASTGALGAGVQITNDASQVKYGVKGLSAASAGYSRNLWAFWTTTTRGRTAINYNSRDSGGNWIATGGAPTTISALPVPAGLTAVSDPAPLLLPLANVSAVPTAGGAATTKAMSVIEVTYSGTGPDGNVDLYESRYVPDDTFDKTFTGYGQNSAKLDLTPFPAVTEILTPTGPAGGWYQSRDVAWSRTSALNLLVKYVKGGSALSQPLLYDNTGKPLFSRAVFDRASGLLVVTNVPVPDELPDASGATLHTVYVDYATGRVRFVPALRATTAATMSQNYEVRAFFSPLARRLTTDSRADTGPITFLDDALKADAANLFPNTGINADRRWYIWRKSGSGAAAASATIYYKTQRLTAFLGYPVDRTKPISITIGGAAYGGAFDVHNVSAVLNPDGTIKYLPTAQVSFPISSLAEGQAYSISYMDTSGNAQTWPAAGVTDTIQWQDEVRSNDSVPPTDATAGLATVVPGYEVPLDQTVNENNVSAFLDTDSYNNTAGPPTNLNTPHKVWLFWNSTRNGTADVYYQTINPLFTAGP